MHCIAGILDKHNAIHSDLTTWIERLEQKQITVPECRHDTQASMVLRCPHSERQEE